MKNTLRLERAKLKLTQEALASKVNVSRQTIYAIETGKFLPSCQLALKIATICGQRVEAIFLLESEDWE